MTAATPQGRAVDRLVLQAALDRSSGAVAGPRGAARALGVHPSTVHRWINKDPELLRWHNETYPLSVRQPPAAERKRPAARAQRASKKIVATPVDSSGQ